MVRGEENEPVTLQRLGSMDGSVAPFTTLVQAETSQSW